MTEQNHSEETKNPMKIIASLFKYLRAITLTQVSVVVGILTLFVAGLGFLAIDKQNRYQNRLAAFDRIMPTIAWDRHIIGTDDKTIVVGIPVQNTGTVSAKIKTIATPMYGCRQNILPDSSVEALLEMAPSIKANPRTGYYVAPSFKDETFKIAVTLPDDMYNSFGDTETVDFIIDIYALIFYPDIWFFDDMLVDLELDSSVSNDKNKNLIEHFF